MRCNALFHRVLPVLTKYFIGNALISVMLKTSPKTNQKLTNGKHFLKPSVLIKFKRRDRAKALRPWLYLFVYRKYIPHHKKGSYLRVMVTRRGFEPRTHCLKDIFMHNPRANHYIFSQYFQWFFHFLFSEIYQYTSTVTNILLANPRPHKRAGTIISASRQTHSTEQACRERRPDHPETLSQFRHRSRCC